MEGVGEGEREGGREREEDTGERKRGKEGKKEP